MDDHISGRVSPFRHPRIKARLPAPRGLSQAPTSFIASRCQGIHHTLLTASSTRPPTGRTGHQSGQRIGHDLHPMTRCTSPPLRPGGILACSKGYGQAPQTLALGVTNNSATPRHLFTFQRAALGLSASSRTIRRRVKAPISFGPGNSAMRVTRLEAGGKFSDSFWVVKPLSGCPAGRPKKGVDRVYRMWFAISSLPFLFARRSVRRDET